MELKVNRRSDLLPTVALFCDLSAFGILKKSNARIGNHCIASMWPQFQVPSKWPNC